MNTMTLDKFEIMDNQELAAIEGGKNHWQANVVGVTTSGLAGVCIAGSTAVGAYFGYTGN